MATVNDVPIQHRGLAGKIPLKVLARLSRAELVYRVKHAKQLHDAAAKHPVPESALAVRDHAARILEAEPAAEYVETHRKHNERLQAAPAHLQWEYRAMMQEHKEAHEYPPGLVAAIERTLLGQAVIGDNELAAVAEASVAHAARVKP
jgi:transposase